MINLLPLLFPIGLGWLTSKTKLFPKNTADVLNQYVIIIAFPALILQKASLIEFRTQMLTPIIIPWLAVAFTLIVILALAKMYQWKNQVTGVLLLLIALGNTSFLGFPLVQHFYGDSGLAVALVYDQIGSFLALSIYGTVIIAIYSNHGNTVSIANIIKKIISFPPFICLVIALIFPSFIQSNLIQNIVQPIASTLIPVVLIAVGMQLRFTVKSEYITPLIIGLSMKMVLIPLSMYLIFSRIIDTNSLVFKVSIFELAMAPMITAAAMASLAGFSKSLSSAIVSYGILIAFITLPVLHKILEG